MTATATKKSNYKWFYKVAGEHNHRPSLHSSAHITYRKRYEEQINLAKSLTKFDGVKARELSSAMRDKGDRSRNVFTNKDVYNDRQKIRDDLLGVLTPTQAWVKILQGQQLKHTIQYDDYNKVTAVFWTYPWCQKMWKVFLEVLGMDNTYKTNRFKMYLFQITGVTDQNSVVNFGFGLINTEKEEGYRWL